MLNCAMMVVAAAAAVTAAAMVVVVSLNFASKDWGCVEYNLR